MTTHSEDAPLVGANEFDGVDDDTISDNDYRGMNWRKTIFAGLGLAALLLVASHFAYQNYFRYPERFTVAANENLLDHTGGNLSLAIDVAERVGLPVVATPMGGESAPVSYKDARRLINQTATVQLNVPIYEGDEIDARGKRVTRRLTRSDYDAIAAMAN